MIEKAKERRAVKELMLKQSKASTILPARTAAHLAGGDTGSAETKVGGSDYGDDCWLDLVRSHFSHIQNLCLTSDGAM